MTIRANLASVLLSGAMAVTAADSRGTPTFTKDIAPILYERCAVCHREGDIGPMKLLTYEQVRPWSRAIKDVVVQGKMPPWYADPNHGKFRNDRRLTKEQVAKIVSWVAAGSPKGDVKDMPPPPKFAEGWSFQRPPDLVIEMPLHAKVPADGILDMQNYYVKVPFTEEKWVEAVELRPGNRSVVHHSIVNIVSLPDTVKPEDLITGKKLGRIGWKLIGQAPGKGAESHHHGTAKRIVPGTYFEFNMHYTTNGKEQTDKSLLGLWFAKDPVHHEVLTTSAAQELWREGQKIPRGKLPNIPPNVDNWEIVGKMAVKDDITVYSMSPHMHFRGKDMRYTVRYPDGRDEVVLNVPKYNYEWQLNYEFDTPLKVPAGSTISVLSHYDNSKNNPKNPAPNEEVIWGQQSWNEMFIPWMEYSVDKLDMSKLSREEIDKLRKPAARPAIVE